MSMLSKSLVLGVVLTSTAAFSDQSIYCPKNSATISVGMTVAQIIAACGQPLSQEPSDQPVQTKIPMQQYIYNNFGQSNPLDGMFGVVDSNPAFNQTGLIPSSNSAVMQLEIDVIDNKIYAIRMNGSSTNALTICGSVPVNVGDPADKAYSACGAPGMVNNSFLLKTVQTQGKPEVWTYQFDPYQPAVRLLIVDGKLDSIN